MKQRTIFETASWLDLQEKKRQPNKYEKRLLREPPLPVTRVETPEPISAKVGTPYLTPKTEPVSATLRGDGDSSTDTGTHNTHPDVTTSGINNIAKQIADSIQVTVKAPDGYIIFPTPKDLSKDYEIEEVSEPDESN